MPPPPPPPPPPFLDQGSGRGGFAYERGVIRDLQAYVADVANQARGGRGSGQQRDRQTLRSTIRQMIDAILATPFTITVPGTHRGFRDRGSISNQGLLLSLARIRKPFIKRVGDELVPDRAMLRRARVDLMIEFENATEIPLLLDLEQAVARSAIETCVGRFDGTLRDVAIKRNSFLYDKWKRTHGLDSRTGQATGNLRDTVQSLLRLNWGRRRR